MGGALQTIYNLQDLEPIEITDTFTLRIDAEVPRLGETKNTIKYLKANKTAGHSNITCEIPKVNAATITLLLHPIFSRSMGV